MASRRAAFSGNTSLIATFSSFIFILLQMGEPLYSGCMLNSTQRLQATRL